MVWSHINAKPNAQRMSGINEKIAYWSNHAHVKPSSIDTERQAQFHLIARNLIRCDWFSCRVIWPPAAATRKRVLKKISVSASARSGNMSCGVVMMVMISIGNANSRLWVSHNRKSGLVRSFYTQIWQSRYTLWCNGCEPRCGVSGISKTLLRQPIFFSFSFFSLLPHRWRIHFFHRSDLI